MWARVSRYQFPPLEVESVIEYFDAALAVFSTQPGLKRADVYVNRDSGAGITITVWESRDAMKASEEAADQVRDEIALQLTGWIQDVEEYELARSASF